MRCSKDVVDPLNTLLGVLGFDLFRQSGFLFECRKKMMHVVTEEDNHVSGSSINFAHHSDLETFFFFVLLVDALQQQ
jgi:hypothetical protein